MSRYGFRTFRVIQELKANCDPDTGHLSRRKRSKKHMPNNWDDYPVQSMKNWKKYRKTKYRTKTR